MSITLVIPLADAETLFKGLADPTRIRILNLLAAGELCVCDIVGILGLPQSTVSRHLGYLMRSGLIEVSRAWKFSHYRLAEPTNDLRRRLLACVHSCFDDVESLPVERALAESRRAERERTPC